MPLVFSGWEDINSLIINNIAYIIAFLFVLNLILFISLLSSTRSRRKMLKKYQELMSGYEAAELEQMLIEYRKKTDGFADRVLWLEQAQRELENKLALTVQKVGIIRYNAFPEMGSDLSFSVALLDAKANGIVVTSIYGREESRTFAKPIENGASSYRLTDEENQAIKKAMESGKQR